MDASSRQRTIAWPLALVYAVLIVFASLFPFEGWRTQGISPLEFFLAKIPPPYWTWFDVGINIAGYAPLGFLLCLAWMRRGWRRSGWLLALALGTLLSFGMEFLQIFLPKRVSSNMDWLLNSAGTLLGAVLALLAFRLGLLRRWNDVRGRWFAPDAHGAIVLLLLWPAALLFPPPLPFGLGQVFERVQGWIIEVLENTAFESWMPALTPAVEPLSPIGELACVMLGLLIPCWLAFGAMGNVWRRVAVACLVVLGGIAVTGLSAALSYGPAHAWDWLGMSARMGTALALVLALAQVSVPRRVCVLLLLVGLMVYLNLLNQAPASPYYAEALQSWEQGRFIRFFGLSQWLGWGWPLATLVYALLRLARRPVESAARRP
ncbi:MAG: VanZ family protein [Comamonas sp.]